MPTDSVTHTAVKTAARAARKPAPDMPIAPECATDGGKRQVKAPDRDRLGTWT
ncbi:hypothetical protein GCM10028832_16680 [Streptomyces sparsus]